MLNEINEKHKKCWLSDDTGAETPLTPTWTHYRPELFMWGYHVIKLMIKYKWYFICYKMELNVLNLVFIIIFLDIIIILLQNNTQGMVTAHNDLYNILLQMPRNSQVSVLQCIIQIL